MSKTPLEPRPIAAASEPGVLEPVRSWMRTIIELNTRPLDERQDLRNPPAWLRVSLLISFFIDVGALTRLAPHDSPVVAALTVVYALTMLVPPVASPYGMIRTPRVAFLVTLMLLWSPLETFLVVAFGTLLAVVAFRLYEPLRALLNTVFWAYPAALASAAGHAVANTIADPLLALSSASLTILIVYLAMNFTLAALYRYLIRGEPFLRYWWRLFSENPLSQVLAAPVPILLGVIALGLGHDRRTLIFLTALSAVTMPAGRAQLAVFLASQRTVQDIVRALMIALERTVPGAQAHAERVSNLVSEVGRRLRVSAGTLESWRTAALLHDIGLIDAGSRMASPASHAVVGARILASYPDTIVADMVRDHHTRWSVLPSWLRGTTAVGVRVLAAAECYDELRHGTPTSPGLVTHAATAAALRPVIGTQLDPRIASVVLETAKRLEPKAAP